MDFFEVLGKRRSIRKFRQREVEEEKLQKILEACNRAPSAGNLQAYKIFVVRSQEKRESLATVGRERGFFREAPISLIFCAAPEVSASLYGERGKNLYSIQDATIAAAYAQLAATSQGLATVWVGAFDEEKIKEIIGTDLKPVAILPLGYAAEEPEFTSRKSLKELTQGC
ncbi:MAG: nitroreductase family protein [Candidatus Aenigmarchaeota archaeon]|nr:nitroreductase family protein [Candidatus Aenigmarchaeota archaeon]